MVFVPLFFTFGFLALCFSGLDFDDVMFFLAKFFTVLITIIGFAAFLVGIVTLPHYAGLNGWQAIAAVGTMLAVFASALIALLP